MIENELKKKSTEEQYGLARISESESVTETDLGLVLSVKEKNAGIEGTLGNKVKKLEQISEKSKIIKTAYPLSVCPGAHNMEGSDGVSINLLNNGLHIVSGIMFIDNVDTFVSASAQNPVLRFPVEYAFESDTTNYQVWTGAMISATNGLSVILRIPRGTSDILAWGGTLGTHTSEGVYIVNAVY